MEETRNENNHEKVNERKHGIVVEHVYKSFGKEHVLVDVNLEIPPGKIYGVVGNNGSGKTRCTSELCCGTRHMLKRGFGQSHHRVSAFC